MSEVDPEHAIGLVDVRRDLAVEDLDEKLHGFGLCELIQIVRWRKMELIQKKNKENNCRNIVDRRENFCKRTNDQSTFLRNLQDLRNTSIK